MSKRIIIKGDDLAYFQSIIDSANSGELGEISEVRVVVNDDNQLSFGTNGYVSEEFGIDADLPLPPYENHDLVTVDN